ncbi:hypothetical protein GGE12_005446 [Rhizobium mongolense]|uniref:Uncharacterized protein n=1 Tax=Rhizobium mongolense TaxID=57676 RepID=A0A7W6RSI9_9HYPH|nr:hypothetical protein [Rhizobium mongolense]
MSDSVVDDWTRATISCNVAMLVISHAALIPSAITKDRRKRS